MTLATPAEEVMKRACVVVKMKAAGSDAATTAGQTGEERVIAADSTAMCDESSQAHSAEPACAPLNGQITCVACAVMQTR